jgi:hypothetical protein
LTNKKKEVHERMPPRAIANDLDFGQIPPELEVLNIPEQIMLSINRARAMIVELRATGGVAGQRAIKGNAITFPMDTQSIARHILPRRLADVSEELRIIFAGSRVPTKIQLAKILSVCRTRVRAGLMWLIDHNPLYFGMGIDEEALQDLPDSAHGGTDEHKEDGSGVPDVFMHAVVHLVPVPRYQEGEGYAATDFFAPAIDATAAERKADNRTEEEKQKEEEEKDAAQVFEPVLQESGIIDVHGIGVPQDAEREAGLNHLIRDMEAKSLRHEEKERQQRETTNAPRPVQPSDSEVRSDDWEAEATELLAAVEQKTPIRADAKNPQKSRILVVPHGRLPASEYMNPNIWMGAFPRLFPYGRGGPEVAGRRTELNMNSWVQHVLEMRDNRFRTSPALVLVLYNVMHRRRLCWEARLHTRVPSWKVTAKRLAAITQTDIQMALGAGPADASRARSPGSSTQQRTRSSSSSSSTARERTTSLLSTMESVMGKIPGTDWKRKRIRKHINSSMLMYGIPSFFITINPAELYHRIPAYYVTVQSSHGTQMTEKFDFDSRADPLPGFPTFAERCQAVVKDPVAIVKFFNVTSDTSVRPTREQTAHLIVDLV